MASWPDLPFNLIVSGITNCGKSRLVLSLLQTTFRGRFDRVVIFCPTFKENRAYNRLFIYKDPDILVAPPQTVRNNFDAILKTYSETYGGNGDNTLFLVDDCANQKDAKIKSCELTRLAFSGRHLGISVWFVTQKYNAVVKDFRDNIRALILFYEKDEESLKTALSENGIIPKEDRASVVETLKSGKRYKLVLRLEYPYDYRIID